MAKSYHILFEFEDGGQMELNVAPIGDEYFSGSESDVAEILYTHSGLRIVIDTNKSRFAPVYLEIFFRDDTGFRCLDEGDLIGYWESDKFRSGHHVYEILSGGWISGEALSSGILSIGSSIKQREWLVCTSNRCITVLSGGQPLLREFYGSPSKGNYVQ